jgi:hypothetical protein
MLGVVVGDGAVGKVLLVQSFLAHPLNLSHLRRRAFSYLTRPTHFQYVVMFLFSNNHLDYRQRGSIYPLVRLSRGVQVSSDIVPISIR